MKRLAWALAVLLTAGPGPLWAQSPAPPIFDGHIHYSAPDWSVYPPDRIFAILDQAGITRALVSSTPDDGTLKLYERDPKRIVPILRPYRTRDDMGTWWRDPSIVPYLEERLKRGVHKGIGEFHVHGRDIKTPVLKRITELAVQHNIYLHAHSDDAAVQALFELEPRARIIWAHAGMSSGAAAVGALMDRYPNLWADLSYRSGDVAPGGTLDPEWRVLLLRHADRFLYGSDTWTTSRWESVPALAAEGRRYLSQLPRDVAEKIAYRNAERLFP
ncbi:MAG TPA: amidohydrolase family protein [Methylomirabilota bacterium]|nr:amidohydrolase family protein [Methylomirabilota bacterium]